MAIPDELFERLSQDPEAAARLMTQMSPAEKAIFAQDATAWRERHSEPTSLMESFARGGVEGLTLNHGAEIQAGANTAYQKLAGDSPESLGDIYLREHAKAQKGFDDAATDNPKSSLAGNAFGGVPWFLVPGANGIKGTAALGAIAGEGASEGSLVEGELGEVAGDVALGGTIGAVAHKAGDYIGKGVSAGGKWLGDKVSDASDWMLGKHLGAGENASEVGRNVFESDVPVFARTKKGIGESLEEPMSDIGEQEIKPSIQKLNEKQQETGRFSDPEQVAAMHEEMLKSDYYQASGNRKLASMVEGETAAIRNKNEPLPFGQRVENKRAWDHKAKRGAVDGQPYDSDVARTFGEMADNERIDTDVLAPQIDEAAGGQYLEGNRKFNKLKTAQDTALSGTETKPWKRLAGAAGGVTAAGIVGSQMGPRIGLATAAAGAVAYVAKTRGRSAAASVGKHLSTVLKSGGPESEAAALLSKDPEGLGKFAEVLLESAARSPEAFKAAHEELQSNPMYLKLLEMSENEEYTVDPANLQGE